MKKLLVTAAFACTLVFVNDAMAAKGKGGGGGSNPPPPPPPTTVSPVQATARPMGLQPFGLVHKSGSDARALDFNANYLPYFRQLIDQNLSEGASFSSVNGFKLDPSRLFLRTQSDQPIRIYFVHEGAGYHNSLGFSTKLAGAEQDGTKYLLFPDASFTSVFSTTRTALEPLIVGDYIEIGTGAPGLQLDFFLIANGAGTSSTYGGTQMWGPWYNNKALNSDGLQHVVAFLLPESRYVLIGFEDIDGGGDRDYNDCLFVVDIGEVNAQNLFDESTLPN